MSANVRDNNDKCKKLNDNKKLCDKVNSQQLYIQTYSYFKSSPCSRYVRDLAEELTVLDGVI